MTLTRPHAHPGAVAPLMPSHPTGRFRTRLRVAHLGRTRRHHHPPALTGIGEHDVPVTIHLGNLPRGCSPLPPPRVHDALRRTAFVAAAGAFLAVGESPSFGAAFLPAAAREAFLAGSARPACD